VDAGVHRFVFLSSIKVNGERTERDRPFCADDPANPTGAYAVSKHEAEEGLWEIQQKTGMDVVVIRPTLVYGPGVKANFQTMMRWVYRGIPLPFASIDNHRSLIALDNLVDFIRTCCIRPEAANRTWLVSDGEDLSTPELLTRLGVAFGKSTRLFRLPAALLRAGAGVLGYREQIRRLLESLQVDISTTRERLDWSAPQNVDDALRKTAEHFLKERRA
jgi:nucleoside-diphosphate-sugar epimerase